MRIANGQAGPGVVAKQTIDQIKKAVKEDVQHGTQNLARSS